MRYRILAIGFAGLSVLLGLAGLHAIAAGLFILPVALARFYGFGRAGLALLFFAALLGVVVSGSPGVAVFYGAIASLGLLIGALALRQWPFGWIVAALSTAIFALVCGGMLWNWEQVRKDTSISLAARAEQFNEIEEADSSPQAGAMAETLRTMDREFEALIFGSVFMIALLSASFVLHVVQRAAPGALQIRSRFALMRPPEGLVWLAIGLALLWFLELQFEARGLQIVVWNGGLALTAIYWINGLSIVYYAMERSMLGPMMRLAIGMAIVIFVLQTAPVFTALGFFDTWLDLRKRYDRLLENRSNPTP